MSGTIAALRSALAGSLATVNLRASELVPDQVNPPVAVVYRRNIEYSQDFGGAAVYHFGVSVYASRSNDRSSQDFLDALCEPSGLGSLKAAVEDDSALTALCDWVFVSAVTPTQIAAVGGVEFLVVEFTVDLVGAGR